ncbi:MAG TPA: hypothetical protein VJQ46_10155, partial [Gemmatimonadales bacterium]|nr:hypothetical protein [Gemmatimonadales bacterium]
MYRIELAPGEITVFRTIEELATGVRNGLITPKARIYHSASDKWLPIQFHPHYKQALELNSGNAKDAPGHKRGASSKQASPKGAASKPSKEGFTFLNVPISPVTPLPKTKTALADLPYIGAERPSAEAPATEPARPSLPEERAIQQAATQTPAKMPTADKPTASEAPIADKTTAEQPIASSPFDRPSEGGPADHSLPIEHSPAYDAPEPVAPVGRQPVNDVPAAHRARTEHSRSEHSRSEHSRSNQSPFDHSADDVSLNAATVDSWPSSDTVAHAPVDHAPVDHSPAHETFYDAPIDHSPVPHSPDHHTPVHHSPVRHSPIHAAPPPRAEERVVEEPFRDAPRARLAVEELFTPPAPRVPLPPAVTASPVIELPRISYPEITPVEPPVAEHSSSGSRSKRTMPLVAAVVLLAAGGYASTLVFSLGRSDGGFTAASTMADRPVVPV